MLFENNFHIFSEDDLAKADRLLSSATALVGDRDCADPLKAILAEMGKLFKSIRKEDPPGLTSDSRWLLDDDGFIYPGWREELKQWDGLLADLGSRGCGPPAIPIEQPKVPIASTARLQEEAAKHATKLKRRQIT